MDKTVFYPFRTSLGQFIDTGGGGGGKPSALWLTRILTTTLIRFRRVAVQSKGALTVS